MVPVLKARLLVQACIRAAEAKGASAFVRRRGFDEAGAVVIKLCPLDGTAVVLTQMQADGGELRWLRASGPHPVPDADAEAYIERAVKRDPDLWVLEVEDREARHPLDQPMID